MYMSNASLKCVAGFRNLACMLEEELQILEQLYVTSNATYSTKMSKSSKEHNSAKSSSASLLCIRQGAEVYHKTIIMYI